eukprot:9647072-Alexandrium_andersonii.AAC.1
MDIEALRIANADLLVRHIGMPLGNALHLLAAVGGGQDATAAPVGTGAPPPGGLGQVGGAAAAGPVTAPPKALAGPPTAAKGSAACSVGGSSALAPAGTPVGMAPPPARRHHCGAGPPRGRPFPIRRCHPRSRPRVVEQRVVAVA